MLLISGTHLGTYEVLGPLGAGGMGEVYRARDTRLGREVAVKVLPAEVASSPDRLARFEREARTVAGLNHPNIVTLHSVEDEDGVRFLTMELVEGQTLSNLIAPGGAPLSRLLDLAIPLTDALVAAHERGVIHRDLKPSNIMVTREGRVKVLDFGLAKIAGDEPPPQVQTLAATADSPISGAGQVMGTIPYMAPEQLRGEPVDARSDLFALGIILYEMATGRRPFTGDSSVDISSSILRDTPQPLTVIRADLPGDLERIVSRCLEKNPRERIQSALDVNNELRRLRKTLERVEPEKPASDKAASIAVLPFVNRSRDEEDEYFSDGLADELLNVLSKIKGLRVIARSSAFMFKGKQVSVAEIGKTLDVATVLEGSVRKSGNRVRISVQLVKVADSSHLWSETYDRTLEDIFAVQDDIAQSVVKELEVTLLEGEMPKAQPTVSQEAYALYLQARALHYRSTHADNLTGIGYLERALELDPKFAPAWFGLADTLVYDYVVFGGQRHDEVYPRARAAAETALRLDPKLADAHLAMARVLGELDWNWPAADIEMRKALELDPNNMLILWIASEYALVGDRLDEALQLIERAVAVDPAGDGAYFGLGGVRLRRGQLAEAEAAYRKASELNPTGAAAHAYLGISLLQRGEPAKALAAMERETDEGLRLYGRAITLDAVGQQGEADRALATLESDFADRRAWSIGSIYASRQLLDQAFAWLDRAYRQREGLMMFIKSDPFVKHLAPDPRYKVLLRKLKLKE